VLFGEIIPTAVESFLESVNCADWLSSLIVDGIIAGVGSVLGFCAFHSLKIADTWRELPLSWTEYLENSAFPVNPSFRLS